MIVYLDVGNTHIKLLQFQDDIEAADLSLHTEIKGDWWRQVMTPPREVIGICVRARSNQKAIDAICRQHWDQSVRWLTTTATAAGLRNAYTQVENLGVDRWAGMAGARSLYRGNLIVADFGTATTFDALRADGQHLGGWIVPGVAAMRAMHAQRLPHLYTAETDTAPPHAKTNSLATDTMAALESGVWQTQIGALQRFAKLAARAGLHDPGCILTGGEAESIAELLAQPVHLVPRLIFHGMQRLAQGI